MKTIYKKYTHIHTLLFLYSLLLLNGCGTDVILMNPKGDIGLEERSLVLTVFCLMLIIVIPVIVMTIVFSIKYRATNSNNTKYDPNWSESKKIEYTVWFIPIVIILILSVITWRSTHKLDPKNPILYTKTQPITVNVIALDWKWLFIYPQYHIAVINECAFPVHVPVHFNITSNSVMNSFFIPQLGSQIYAMAGMRTQLHLIANETGKYKGISSNFSGQGFSGMKFTAIATSNLESFNQWVNTVQMSNYQINNMNDYEELAKPSKFHPVIYFSNVQPNLFLSVINKFNNQHRIYN